MNDLTTNERKKQSFPKYANVMDGYQAALKVLDDVILKNYISNLSNMEIIPLKKSIIDSNIKENVLFFKITEMVYEKDEFATYKFASVFNALSMTESAVFIIIDSDGIKNDFYMGVRSLDENRTTSSLKNTVKNAMNGQFPGIKTVDYTIEDIQDIISEIESDSIASVSCVANSRNQSTDKNQNFIQGLEKLVLSMQGEKYTGIIIANGTTQEQLRELRKGYESIYTQLSPFATTQINYTSNDSINYSVSKTNGSSSTKSKTDNISKTSGTTLNSSTSETNGESKESIAGKTINGVLSAALILNATLDYGTSNISNLTKKGMIFNGFNSLTSLATKSESHSTTKSESISNSQSETSGTSYGTSDTINYSEGVTQGQTKGISQAMTLNLHDKSIENMLERIDKQLKRIDEFESLGMYECAAYFLSDNLYTAEVAAATYKSLMRGENSGVEVSAINSWGLYEKQKTKLVGEYVKNFIHPVFKYQGIGEVIEVTPCSLVSGNELAIHMGLPRKSVCGLPVIEHADFGKEIVTYDGNNSVSGLNLGNIFNMGSNCKNKVKLNVNSLAMHTFVTGSTGSGKSNTVYEMVRQLDVRGINYLIVEPAKGEYKNVFGSLPDVRVLGTNPQYSEILKINPFKFPKGIHVLEHIDRLIEIFNVCWPMYAAMPAVLKEAVLKAYENCGWDLFESTNMYSDNLFPTFKDLENELDNVITQSLYSEEVKSNYKGSLLTRIKSLTNGLNSQIFSSNEIDNTELFDKNVIVDISRVGSSETKSLIMGILIMRLSEHRMSNTQEMNVPLKHVTVLEEAHNILKAASSQPSSEEGSNMSGKSVEMISNAIAEMRTYGEGFIIADQSPSAVDISAIRNTNTKIIMRLPDESDRRLAGKSAGLKDEQLDEIAKLPKGVAVVYQNDWVEPVLCKVQKYRGQEKRYTYNISGRNKHRKIYTYITIISNLIYKLKDEELDMNIKELTDLTIMSEIPTETKINILKAFQMNKIRNKKLINSIMYELICNPEVERETEKSDSIEEWKNTFIYFGDAILSYMDEEIQNMVVECILEEQIENHGKPKEYIEYWNKYLNGEMM